MPRTMRRAMLGSVTVLLSISWNIGVQAADGDKNFLWKVRSDSGGEVYLLGSMHVGKKEWYPLSKEIEDAFEKSKFLVVELDPAKADQEKMQQLLAEKGTYTFGDSISKHISEKTDERVKAYLEKSETPAVGVFQCKPWALGMTLVQLEAQRLGCDTELGIDKHFLNQAQKAEKEVLELESATFQIELLAGFDDETQEKILLWSLEQVEDMKTDLPKSYEAWNKGDARAFE